MLEQRFAFLKPFLLPLLLALSFFLFVSSVHAAQVTLAWDANDPEPDGYRVFQRTEGGSYDFSSPVWSGSQVTCTIDSLAEGDTYYFVVRAYAGSDESGDSNEVSYFADQSVPASYAIQATAGANGAISPSGTATIVAGGSQTYTITPNTGYYIADVSVDGASVGAVSSYTFDQIAGSHTISATFAVNQYGISASAGTNGSISPAGTTNVAYGGSQTYTITADSGYQIADVTVDGISIGAVSSYLFEGVAASHTISASFAVNTYMISAYCGDNGTISPAGDTGVNGGGSLSVVITPDSNFVVDQVYVDGIAMGAITSYQFNNIDCDHSIEAYFVEQIEENLVTITVDDGESGTSSTGTWKVSNTEDPYGSQSLYSNKSGSTYTFEAAISGDVELSLWWTQHQNRCETVPVDIYDGNILVDSLYVNQTADGGQWNVLGTYEFESGTAKLTIAMEGSGCSVSADAVEFAAVPSEDAPEEIPPATEDPQIIILDDGELGTSSTGTWGVSGAPDPYGSQSLYSNEPGSTYSFNAEISGTVEISTWWTEHANRCTNIPVGIYDGDELIDTIWVNQTTDGGQWNVLGTYEIASGAARLTVMSNESDCSVSADAVEFTVMASEDVPEETPPATDDQPTVIVDDGELGTSSTGTWGVSSTPDPYGSQSLYSNVPGSTYSFESTVSTSVEISVWWTQHANRCTSVPISIYDGSNLIDTQYVNQTADGGQWNLFGVYEFASGTATITIASDVSGCSVSADAVKFAAPTY